MNNKDIAKSSFEFRKMSRREQETITNGQMRKDLTLRKVSVFAEEICGSKGQPLYLILSKVQKNSITKKNEFLLVCSKSICLNEQSLTIRYEIPDESVEKFTEIANKMNELRKHERESLCLIRFFDKEKPNLLYLSLKLNGDKWEKDGWKQEVIFDEKIDNVTLKR